MTGDDTGDYCVGEGGTYDSDNDVCDLTFEGFRNDTHLIEPIHDWIYESGAENANANFSCAADTDLAACKTRVLTPGNSPRNNTLRNRINKNIRGEITVDLDDPLAIRGRLVQQIASVENLPLEQQKRAEVTWINFTPLVGKPAPQDLRKQNPSGK